RYLPKIYLGGREMDSEKLTLAKTFVNYFGADQIKRIDFSRYDIPQGVQEVVVVLKKGEIVRFSPKNCIKQLTHYSILSRALLKEKGSAIVDLRIPNVAIVDRGFACDVH